MFLVYDSFTKYPKGKQLKENTNNPDPAHSKMDEEKNGKMEMSVAWVLASVPVFTLQFDFFLLSFSRLFVRGVEG